MSGDHIQPNESNGSDLFSCLQMDQRYKALISLAARAVARKRLTSLPFPFFFFFFWGWKKKQSTIPHSSRQREEATNQERRWIPGRRKGPVTWQMSSHESNEFPSQKTRHLLHDASHFGCPLRPQLIRPCQPASKKSFFSSGQTVIQRRQMQNFKKKELLDPYKDWEKRGGDLVTWLSHRIENGWLRPLKQKNKSKTRKVKTDQTWKCRVVRIQPVRQEAGGKWSVPKKTTKFQSVLKEKRAK